MNDSINLFLILSTAFVVTASPGVSTLAIAGASIHGGRRQGFDYWQVLECTHAYNNSPYFGDTPEQKKWEGYDAFDQTKAATAFLRTRRRSTMPSGICWRPCARPDWRRTRSSSSPRTTATCSGRRG